MSERNAWATLQAMRRKNTAKAGPATFVLINRNLCHYPIVRSPGTTPPWQLRVRPHEDDVILCCLHRDHLTNRPRVVLSLPANAQIVRAPSRFDFDLLLRLCVMAARKKPAAIHERAFKEGADEIRRTNSGRRKKMLFHRDPLERDREHGLAHLNEALRNGRGYMAAVAAMGGEPNPSEERVAGKISYRRAAKQLRQDVTVYDNLPLKFRSMRKLLLALGRSPNKAQNYQEVKDSLQLWWNLQALFTEWYQPPGQRQAKAYRGRRTVNFLSDVTFDGSGGVRIKIDAEFLIAHSRYAAKVALPLPLSSEAAVNLSLWLDGFSGMKTTRPVKRNFQRLGNLIGLPRLTPGKLSQALDKAVDQINRHRAFCGATRIVVAPDGRNPEVITFRVKNEPDDYE